MIRWKNETFRKKKNLMEGRLFLYLLCYCCENLVECHLQFWILFTEGKGIITFKWYLLSIGIDNEPKWLKLFNRKTLKLNIMDLVDSTKSCFFYLFSSDFFLFLAFWALLNPLLNLTWPKIITKTHMKIRKKNTKPCLWIL